MCFYWFGGISGEVHDRKQVREVDELRDAFDKAFGVVERHVHPVALLEDGTDPFDFDVRGSGLVIGHGSTVAYLS